MSLFGELKRRNVIRVGVLYLVSCWVILQVANLLFTAFELPAEWTRLVFAILILGFPVVIALAWLYEITPEGLKRTSEAQSESSSAYPTGHKITVLSVVLLVVAIVMIAYDRLMPDTAPEAGASAHVSADSITLENTTSATSIAERSIAVLPFANRSARDEDNYLVDGIHDDILAQLARIGSLVVISRTSVERFRNPAQSMKEIGAVLGVKNILEGSVQRAGDRIRINVQLIDVAQDAHLWSDTFDRELTTENIFAIQSEIATSIAGSLDAALSPAEKAQLQVVPTENLAALEAYFRGRIALEKRTSDAILEAEQHFERAIELDPGYALAFVGLADAYILQAYYGDASIQEQHNLAQPWVEKALAINPNLGEAYISMAELTSDFEQVEALYRKGIDLAPGYSMGYQWYGEFLVNQGRPEEALRQFREAVRVDPLSDAAAVKVGFALEGLGQLDDAGRVYESVVGKNPEFALGHSSFGLYKWMVEGQLDSAIVQLRRAATLDPLNSFYPAYLGVMWSELGDTPKANDWIATSRAIPGSGTFADYAAVYVEANRGGFAGAAHHANAVLADLPNLPFAIWALGLHDLQEGRGKQAVSRYEAAYPMLRQHASTVDNANYTVAVDLAHALISVGENARAKQLLTDSLDHLKSQPRLGGWGYTIADARIYALQNKPDDALAALRDAVSEGWRISWRAYLLHDPVFANLRNKPEFVAIVAELEADMALQLARLRELEAVGAP